MGEKAWLGHHCPLGPGPSHMYTVVPIPQADYSEPSSAQAFDTQQDLKIELFTKI